MSAPRVCAKCNESWGGFHSYKKGWTCPKCRNIPEDKWIRGTKEYEG